MNASQDKQERFMLLFKPVQRNLERFALAMARQTETARDVVAETVLIAYEQFDNLRSPNAFLSFLFTIAVRVYRTHQKREQRTERLNEETIVDLLASETPPDVATDVAAVYKALQQLPESQREAIVLFEIMGVPMKEIREIQGGTLTAVKVRISRGRKKLAAILGVNDTAQQFSTTQSGTTSEPASSHERNQLYSIGVRP